MHKNTENGKWDECSVFALFLICSIQKKTSTISSQTNDLLEWSSSARKLVRGPRGTKLSGGGAYLAYASFKLRKFFGNTWHPEPWLQLYFHHIFRCDFQSVFWSIDHCCICSISFNMISRAFFGALTSAVRGNWMSRALNRVRCFDSRRLHKCNKTRYTSQIYIYTSQQVIQLPEIAKSHIRSGSRVGEIYLNVDGHRTTHALC